MSEAAETPFLKFLHSGIERGGFETDDVLASVLPLMRQTLRACWARAASGRAAAAPPRRVMNSRRRIININSLRIGTSAITAKAVAIYSFWFFWT